MRRPDQPSLFGEVVETRRTRTVECDDGGCAKHRTRPPGDGWRILHDRERATVWCRRTPVIWGKPGPWRSASATRRVGTMTAAAEIARALDGKRAGSDWMARCPAHAERTPSLVIRDGDTGVLVHCHAGCSQRDVIDALARLGLWERPQPPARSPRDRRHRARSHGTTTRPPGSRRCVASGVHAHDPRGTLAERYLNGRELEIDDHLAGRVLRFHPRCPFGRGEFHPCLVAAFRRIEDPDDDGPPVAILRVALDADGGKLDRKMLGPVAGCAIKLDPDEDVSHGLGISEGLETGMSVRAIGWRPVWALGSAGAIETFPVLNGIEALTIFADNDAPAPSEWSPKGRAAGRHG